MTPPDDKPTCPPTADDAAADAYAERLALVEGPPVPARGSGLLRALALAWAERNGIAWPEIKG